MFFIYLGEARTYEERISEFLTVSKKLEIKKLSTGIELYDQTALDQVESNENSDAAENIDIAGAPQHALHEDGDNIEPQAKIEPITTKNAANRRERRTEIVSGDQDFQCQKCEKNFSGPSGLLLHT